MRKPKKAHPIGAKKQSRRVAVKNSLPNGSRARPDKTLQQRVAAKEIEEHAARTDAKVTSRPSQTVNQNYLGIEPPEVGERENTGSRTRIVNKSCSISPTSAVSNGVRVITNGINASTMEWFNIMRRCTERSIGAMHIFLRCRTPEEFFTAQRNLLFGNLDDAFEGINKLIRQTDGNQLISLGDKELPKVGDELLM
jgi:hypothetical protein